jgi:CHAT domain-containing protein
MLHFATHGVIDETRPDRSGLVLTASPPLEDGLLQTREIYGLRLQADLVTLSACQTALGRNVTGEGMIGLTRAFYYAGARAVVASLWDIEDASTSRLMQQFYANLRHGQPIDVALQQAKIALIRASGVTSRPFYWASFVASGRTRASIELPVLTLRERFMASWLARGAALTVLAMLALAVWWWRRRPRVAAVSEAVL